MAVHLLEEYLRDLRDVRRSGSAVSETSYYRALAKLLDSVGATLKPKVQRKEDSIRVRVTAEQKRALVERARRDGLEVSAWLRSLGLREAAG
jgi:hypothetical protein